MGPHRWLDKDLLNLFFLIIVNARVLRSTLCVFHHGAQYFKNDRSKRKYRVVVNGLGSDAGNPGSNQEDVSNKMSL